MNRTEVAIVLDRITEHWQFELAPETAEGWRACLAPIPPNVVNAVLAEVWGEPSPPSQRRFLELAHTTTNRVAQGRPRRNCQDCGGTGWRDVQTASGTPAVWRCDCTPPPPPPDKHPRCCTCNACSIGPPEPDPRPNRGPDPLALAEPEVPGGLF